MIMQKIEAPSIDPVSALERVHIDVLDASALVFALANPSDDWEFDPRSLRAVAQLLNAIAEEALADSVSIHKAR